MYGGSVGSAVFGIGGIEPFAPSSGGRKRVAPIPWPLKAVEELLAGQRITESLAAEAGRLAVDGAQPLSKNGYKVTLTENLVRNTLQSLADEVGA